MQLLSQGERKSEGCFAPAGVSVASLVRRSRNFLARSLPVLSLARQRETSFFFLFHKLAPRRGFR